MFSVALSTILAVVAYGASNMRNHGHVWADEFCTVASTVCASPHWVGGAAVFVILLQLYRLSLRGT
jgi:hypothetical protein